MKFCEELTFEQTLNGVIFTGTEWPAEIIVERGLVEYPQGPHVMLGRRGSLAFIACNGQAAYRRVEDVPGGWRYVRTESVLNGARPFAPEKPKAAPVIATKRYRQIKTNAEVEAFQWLPHAVPPVQLPDWFIRADFEQNKDGILTIRSRSGGVRCEPSDWLLFVDGKIERMGAAAFATDYQGADAAKVAA